MAVLDPPFNNEAINSSLELQSRASFIKESQAVPNGERRKNFATAVFLQVGYHELWNELYECTKNVVDGASMEDIERVDIFVSVVEAQRPGDLGQKEQKNSLAKIESDLKNLVHVGEVIVKKFDNEGADIGSLLKMLEHNAISARDYDAILKLHTKSDDVWRKHGIDCLCGSPAQVVSIFDHFKSDTTLDMIAPKGLVFGPKTPPIEIFPHVVKKYNLEGAPAASFDSATKRIMNQIHRTIFPKGISADSDNDGTREIAQKEMTIVAGTMFWVRYSALHPQELVKALPQFAFSKGYVENLGVEHALERLFATEIGMSGRKIAQISPPPTNAS
jgi:lipopolysaccharide biosynthesis protein